MMRHFVLGLTCTLCTVFALCTPSASVAAARLHAEVSCAPTDKPLTYHCTIKLTDRKTGQPIEHAKFVMYTGMPSMPMAHHMPPVEGTPGKEPGVYHGTLHFEMAGEWAIDIRTSAPSRDQMRHKIMVHKKGTSAALQGRMKHHKQ